MKKVFTLIVLVVSGLSIAAGQCTISVATSTGGNEVCTTSIAQTFTPTCSGILKSVTFPSIYSTADDLRGSYVYCNIQDASGNLLATSNKTNQWYPGAAVTFEFSCKGIAFTSGTLYRFELKSDYTSCVYLINYSTTSVYNGGNAIINGTAQTNRDLYGWTVNLINGSIAAATSSVTQTITPCGGFFNGSNELLTSIQSGTTNGISGSTTAKVWIETSQPADFVKRHYEITPAANASTATGTVTLYFTQAEFDAFNAVNASKLPTSPSDATGKANLKIEKRPGTSNNGTGLPYTYTGTITTIDPDDADIVFNSGASRWEVSFAVTGFSGFFVKSTTAILPLQWLSFSGTLNNQKMAALSWSVTEKDVQQYEVEKSIDTRSYTTIGKVNSKGDGTHTYAFSEGLELSGVAYYRIRQTDVNGRSSFSAIVKLSAAGSNGGITIYPNPVKDVAQVSIPASLLGTEAGLYNATGQKLQSLLLQSQAFTLNLNTYKPGTYMLQFGNGTTVKIIKQ